jgi:type II secretory pathway pseudopilin PulG
MVSLSILIIIALAVATDISRTRHQEELASSARLTLSTLRGLQSRALSATSVKTCNNGTNDLVCELDDTVCVFSPCDTRLVPISVGATMRTTESVIYKFAEVDLGLEDRRKDASNREYLGVQKFAEQNPGSNPVQITSLKAGSDLLSEVTVTFDRQNGAMRINACGNPSGAPPCTGPEPTTLEIIIEHARLGRSKTIRLNTLTGKISIE